MNKLIKTLLILVVLSIAIFIVVNIKIVNIDVIGSNRKDNSEIITEVMNLPADQYSLIFFLKDKIFGHKDLKYIDKYEINWVTPTYIQILIKEKPAIGFVKKDIKNLYFDRDGIINDISEETKLNVPEVKGLDVRGYDIGEKIIVKDSRLLDDIIKISSALKDGNIPLDLIEIDKDKNIKCYIGNIVTELGDDSNLEVKISRLRDIYPEIKDLKGSLDLKEARENMNNEQYIFKKSN